MTIVVGVDVGLRGGLAAVRLLESGSYLVDVIDVPVLDSKSKARVDAIAVQEWLLQHSPLRAFIEVTSAWPKQGISSAYRFGRAAGALESIITVCGIPSNTLHQQPGKRRCDCVAKTRKPRGRLPYGCSRTRTIYCGGNWITAALKRRSSVTSASTSSCSLGPSP
jgi:hypothetical protein